MGLKTLYQHLDDKVHILSRKMGAKASAKHYFSMLEKNNIPIKRLSKEQREAVQHAWNGHVASNGFATHELVYSVAGKFDPFICSELLFRTKIELAMNDFKMKFGFSEKNYFDMFFPNEPMPRTVIRNINGNLLDEHYKPLTDTEAKRILSRYEAVIVKPSIENGFGKSVKKYTADQFDSISKDFSKNYCIQEVLKQYAPLCALNASSVNVVRVISLSLNGVVSPVNYALRCGASGSITDNYITPDGRGMFVVGVTEDGILKNEAFYSCGEKISVAPNGQNFAGIQLPNFKDALAITTRMHEKMPHFGFAAFDICFDEDGSPRVMELNIRGPGVLYYQYANGPLFGNRTQEVIDRYCK